MIIVCVQGTREAGNVSFGQMLKGQLQGELYRKTIATHMPGVLAASDEMVSMEQITLQEYVVKKLESLLPVQKYVETVSEYDTQVESELTYEMLVAREGIDEQYRDGKLIKDAETENTKEAEEAKANTEVTEEEVIGDSDIETIAGDSAGNVAEEHAEMDANVATEILAPSVAEPVVQISREKLNDFDYLIQNFYTVDRTTTINGEQLNAQDLLARDMRLTTTADKPQILIHHTHSQERYADSTEDSATSIVGVGAYLTKLLREQYGFNVIHDTGEYDVIDHQDAYAYAGPAIEKILAENPSIEVVIDIHRDGIGSGHLVSEVNGKQTAKIMFFNGLSRTTANGDLDYLYNPNLSDNLAFSLQLKLAAEEYYPGLTRPNYLKGYRYNLHYKPKSLLVEVGAQTNTVEEAMNAMEPLADLLHKVLAP